MTKQRTEQDRERLDQILRDNAQLIESLADPDDFRAVIIGQTYLETVLTLILELHFENKTKRLPGMSYDTKLSLAAAFDDIKPSWLSLLKTLADIRNDFAHKLGHHKVAPERLNEIRRARRSIEEVKEEHLKTDERYAARYAFPLFKELYERSGAHAILETNPSFEARFSILEMFWLLICVYEQYEPPGSK
jgi:hypothetical protein